MKGGRCSQAIPGSLIPANQGPKHQRGSLSFMLGRVSTQGRVHSVKGRGERPAEETTYPDTVKTVESNAFALAILQQRLLFKVRSGTKGARGCGRSRLSKP